MHAPSDAPANAPAHGPAGTAGDPTAAAARQTSGRRRSWLGTSPRLRTAAVAGVSLGVLLSGAMLLPVPYVSQEPGPTFDTLGSVNEVPLITIEGAETYPTEGQLRLTTVAVVGGPGHRMNMMGLLSSWLAADAVVVPLEQYYPPTATQEQIQERANLQMVTSQTDAAVAALEEIGFDVPTTLTVSYVDETSGAHGVIEPGDVILGLEHQGESVTVTDFATLTDALAQIEPGSDVTVQVERDGEPTEVTVRTGSRHARDQAAGLPVDDEPDGSVLGVGLQPDAELPLDVTYQIDSVGGPSAGLMFALATVDLLTPGDMTGGENVAGTGTIALDGTVGPIGGIRQKVAGAQHDGADYFLVPAQNCAEVAGHVPAGLREVSVDTLGSAREALEVIGSGDDAAIDALPQCTS